MPVFVCYEYCYVAVCVAMGTMSVLLLHEGTHRCYHQCFILKHLNAQLKTHLHIQLKHIKIKISIPKPNVVRGFVGIVVNPPL